MRWILPVVLLAACAGASAGPTADPPATDDLSGLISQPAPGWKLDRRGPGPRPRARRTGRCGAAQRLDLPPVAFVGLEGMQHQLGARSTRARARPRILAQATGVKEVPDVEGGWSADAGSIPAASTIHPRPTTLRLAFLFAGRRGDVGVPADYVTFNRP